MPRFNIALLAIMATSSSFVEVSIGANIDMTNYIMLLDILSPFRSFCCCSSPPRDRLNRQMINALTQFKSRVIPELFPEQLLTLLWGMGLLCAIRVGFSLSALTPTREV